MLLSSFHLCPPRTLKHRAANLGKMSACQCVSTWYTRKTSRHYMLTTVKFGLSTAEQSQGPMGHKQTLSRRVHRAYD